MQVSFLKLFKQIVSLAICLLDEDMFTLKYDTKRKYCTEITKVKNHLILCRCTGKNIICKNKLA